MGAYKAPRELNWMSGVLLLLPYPGVRFYGLLIALGPEGFLGYHGWF